MSAPTRELVMLTIGDSPSDEESSIARPAYINVSTPELIKARDAGCAKLGVRWHALCTSAPGIPVDLADRLKVAGFETADLPHTPAPRALELIDEDTTPRLVGMTVSLFLDLFVFICKLGNPAIVFEVPEPFYIALGGAGLLSNAHLELELEVGDDFEGVE